MTDKVPTPYLVRSYAGRGLNVKQIASKFDLLEDELDTLLEKDKELKRGLELGRADLEVIMQEKLMDKGETGIVLLNARRYLKLDDPVLDAITGNDLKVILSKISDKSRTTLSKVISMKDK